MTGIRAKVPKYRTYYGAKGTWCMTRMMVELVNIGKCYGGRYLFRELNALVQPGECLAIIGRNGSGKSTLLKIIAGLVRPSSGTIRVVANGRELQTDQQAAVIGMVSPEVIFYHPLTAMENLQFLLNGRNLEATEQAALHWLKQVGLEKQGNKPVSSYSTGMRQRLKIAVALALESPLILLDEPSSNLDTEGKDIVGQFIANALAAQKTVVIASNERWETEYASHKITLA